MSAFAAAVGARGMVWGQARDIAAAEHAWAKALDLMADPTIRLLVLDELNIALRYDYLDLEAVVAAFRARRPDLHVVVTGRNAKPALIEAAGGRVLHLTEGRVIGWPALRRCAGRFLHSRCAGRLPRTWRWGGVCRGWFGRG